ncbi:MAG TPA: hypothetical protein PKW35_08735 [Nannocystaceae bacterium]|nr:hypothetical protein [Nannocystaceae bacterium]
MEPLLVVLAELVAVASIAGVVAFVAALLAIVGVALRLIPATRGARLARGLARLFIAVFSASVVLLVILQGPAVGLALRFALGGLAERVGYDLRFSEAHADVLTGELTLEGVRVERPGELRVDVERARIDVSWPSVLTSRFTVQEVELHGVRGFFGAPTRPRRGDARQARPLTIERIDLRDAQIALPASSTSSGHRLEILELSVSPLRSDHAVEDLLAGARGRMRVDALDLAVLERNDGTRWEIAGIPLAKLPGVPEPLARAVDHLDLTLDATASEDRIRLRCTVRLRGLGPDEGGRLGRLIDASGVLSVAFEVTLDPDPGAVMGLRDLDLVGPLVDAFARKIDRPRAPPRR